jgi:hypothetical protein
MGIKRIGVVVATALVAASLGAGTVAAGSSTETTVTRDILLDIAAAASQTCGFPIELHTVGMEVSIRHYGANGTLRSSTLVQHFNGYLLNPANGKTVASRVSGPVRDTYYADGSIAESTSGSTTRTAPGFGLVSGFIGHESYLLVPTGETDEDGFPVYDFFDESFHGIFLGNQGVCAVLA